MIYRLEIYPTVKDMRAEVRKKTFEMLLNAPISNLTIADVYTIEGERTEEQLVSIKELLVNPVSQKSRWIYKSFLETIETPQFDWVIEVGYLPGVTDNTAHTAAELINDLPGSQESAVYSSQMTFIYGEISDEAIQILADSLFNPLIQRVIIKSFNQYQTDQGIELVVPRVKLEPQSEVTQINLNISDAALIQLGKQGIANSDGSRRGPLALDLAYLQAIKEYFNGLRRSPTDVELESIAQTWSEHCKHTIFADPIEDAPEGLFKTYIKKATEEIRRKKGAADICVSVFSDNSGAIAFDEEYVITDKVETHNSPSALDPFGGAITGIVGVNRDTLGFGMGAKPIINRFGFCFAPPDDRTQLYRDKERTQPLLSSRRIIEGVVAGVNSGGNCSGIPTTQGFMYFDERYRGKPLVFVGTVGLLPRKLSLIQKKAQPGDYIVMVGGRVGLDGIHGATFSSEALSTGSPATAVQIGDPITQKKMSDVLVKETRDRGLYHSITDNGAGGLSCSVAEMAKESNGCVVQLEKVPLKYPGLAPWQIWISESQERMTLAVPPEKWPEFLRLVTSRGVEATVIGEFNNSNRCVVTYRNETVMDMEMDFLHNGLPKRQLVTTYPYIQRATVEIPLQTELTKQFIAIVGRLNTASIESISMQYDHEVQGGSVLKPLVGKGRVNSDATVVRPLLNKNKGIVLSHGLYPRYSDYDTYAMAAASIDTAIRNAVAVGAPLAHIALLDNFCWCSANDPERLGQLKRAVEACYDYATAFETPFISGKDSMFNDFKGFDLDGKPITISVPPTLLISAIAVVNDILEVVTPDFKIAGDLVYVLGETEEEIGGSEYANMWDESHQTEVTAYPVPRVDAARNKKLYETYHQAVTLGFMSSGQSLHHGGLAIAIAKSAIAGQMGVEINLNKLAGFATRDDAALFSESQGRILVTVAPEQQADFEKLCANVPYALVGRVRADRTVKVYGINGATVVQTDITRLTASYKKHFGIIHKLVPRALVLSGYGINCEEETAFAFNQAGMTAQIVHINDLISNNVRLDQFELLAVPGGFSFGDDTGSGNAFAQKLKNHLWEDIVEFIKKDHLVIGICNGFQILVNLGLLPALNGHYGRREVALLHNTAAVYSDRWVDLVVNGSRSPWLKDITTFSVPIAHGEGRFYASDAVLHELKTRHLIAAQYIRGEICQYQSLSANPNGSVDDIAALTDESGRILGIMPHPERAISFTQLPHWTFLREQLKRHGKPLPTDGPGLQVFKNARKYFL